MTGSFLHDGVTFAYEILGERRALVFCHGLGGDRAQPKDLLGDVAGWRVHVWDARWHGQTEPARDEGKLSFAQFAADLVALMDHWGLDRAVVGGISMGAGVAARVAVDRPDRVAGLVLVRPAWLDRPSPPGLALFPVVARLLGEMAPAEALAAFQHNHAHALKHIWDVSPPVADSLCEQFTKPKAAERRARLERITASAPVGSLELAAGLSVPAVVIGTERDPVHPFSMAERWAECLPGAELVKIPSKASDPIRHIAAFRRTVRRFLGPLSEETRPC